MCIVMFFTYWLACYLDYKCFYLENVSNWLVIQRARRRRMSIDLCVLFLCRVLLQYGKVSGQSKYVKL